MFDFGCLTVHGFQVVFLLPLLLLPFGWSRYLYEEGVRYTKGGFTTLMSESTTFYRGGTQLTVLAVLTSQLFAPTRLSITFERDGQGRFSDEQIKQIVVRNAGGKVVALKLPTKSILIANHQVRALSRYWA